MTEHPPRRAPNREEIEAISDLAEIEAIIDRADETIIAIKTQLEYLDFAEDDRRRCIGALTFWKIAHHHARKRKSALTRIAGAPVSGGL